MAGIDALGGFPLRLDEMADQLVSPKIQGDRGIGHAPEPATQAVHIEPLRFFQIGDREGDMKQDLSHENEVNRRGSFARPSRLVPGGVREMS